MGTAIGGKVGADSHVWNGDIAEVIIFDRVLTYEEIIELEIISKENGELLKGVSCPLIQLDIM